MSAQANPFQSVRTPHMLRRQISNILIIALAVFTATLSIVILLYLVLYVFSQGLPALNWAFFTELPASFGSSGGGVGQSIQGTLILVGLASLFGVPLGLFVGIYLAEFGHGAFASFVRFLVLVLTGIPTIIFGLFIWVLVVVPSHSFSGFSGGLALAIIMIPIVATTAEEVLRLVPREIREASLALGATQSRTIVTVVVPAALSGVVTGIVLAMARIAGETAPLLMTAFGSTFWSSDITQPIDALPLRIFVFTESPYQIQISQAFAGSIILIMIILIAAFLVRLVTGGFRNSR